MVQNTYDAIKKSLPKLLIFLLQALAGQTKLLSASDIKGWLAAYGVPYTVIPHAWKVYIYLMLVLGVVSIAELSVDPASNDGSCSEI